MDNEFENQKLLIVDDDRVWLNQLSRAMSRRGLIVFEAQSVKDGLDILKKEKFDYGVIDLRLDDGDGLEIITELNRLNPKSKSIILTGFGNIANAVSAIKLGAVDYLSKPANIEDIISSIEYGVYMETNRSWSIDDYRNKFQFGCEYGKLIENGKLTKTIN